MFYMERFDLKYAHIINIFYFGETVFYNLTFRLTRLQLTVMIFTSWFYQDKHL